VELVMKNWIVYENAASQLRQPASSFSARKDFQLSTSILNIFKSLKRSSRNPVATPLTDTYLTLASVWHASPPERWFSWFSEGHIRLETLEIIRYRDGLSTHAAMDAFDAERRFSSIWWLTYPFSRALSLHIHRNLYPHPTSIFQDWHFKNSLRKARLMRRKSGLKRRKRRDAWVRRMPINMGCF